MEPKNILEGNKFLRKMKKVNTKFFEETKNDCIVRQGLKKVIQ